MRRSTLLLAAIGLVLVTAGGAAAKNDPSP